MDKSVHYSDVIMSATASQITIVSIVCSTVDSGSDQGKHQSSASLAFVREIHHTHMWPMDSRHKGPVIRKMFPFNDVIMRSLHYIITTTKPNPCALIQIYCRFMPWTHGSELPRIEETQHYWLVSLQHTTVTTISLYFDCHTCAAALK